MTGRRRILILTSLPQVLLSAVALSACGGGGATAAQAPAKALSRQSATVDVANTVLGQILVDSQGRTLYLFKADSGGTSACTGACATAWPPLLAHGRLSVAGGANQSLVATIQRPNGGLQVTYNGHPLYLFADDQKAGDVNGQGVTAFGAPWFVLSPAGAQISSAASSPVPNSGGVSSSGGGY